MDLKNFSIFTTTFHLSTVVMVLIALVHSVLSVDSQYEACAPRSCGKVPNISYPFWISEEQESYCGLPNFGVSCNNETPMLRISNDDYVIEDIFYTNYSVRLVNSALYDEKCPTPNHNFSLDGTPFHYGDQTVDFYLFYGCPSNPSAGYFTYIISCASNSSYHSFGLFHTEAQQATGYSLDSCQTMVNAPVNVVANFSRLLNMSYSEILLSGFVLNWIPTYCGSCEKSGGRCGLENNAFICFCSDQPRSKTCSTGKGMALWVKILIGVAAAIVITLILLWSVICCYNRKPWNHSSLLHGNSHCSVEAFIREYQALASKRYNYSDIMKMTNSFDDKLGQGGYGCVYKGKLPDGRLVAVKVLNSAKGNGEEFINEVASVSTTSHVNVVALLGFCFEGSKRALIYEFMPNGSLEKFIPNDNSLILDQQLGVELLYKIAIGIAQGLGYLHRGCSTQILHFDIKPHNILLDEDFIPKISDFGLAKLCPTKESIVADARGTIGYIAPEVFSRNFGGISHKSDVYSYGMMILEMVGGKSNTKAGLSHSSDVYFPHWVYKRLDLGEDIAFHSSMTIEENEIVKRMVLVGLWCIQTDPSLRPSMSKVLEMLEGAVGTLLIPPKPFLFCAPRLSATNSFTTSDAEIQL